VTDEQLTKAVKEVFDMRPYFIQDRINLRRPIFQLTTNYGHFGRERPEFTWEMTEAVDDPRTACKIERGKTSHAYKRRKLHASAFLLTKEFSNYTHWPCAA